MTFVSLNYLLSVSTVLIFLRSFPILFNVLGKVSAVFALMIIFDVVKNILRKHVLNKKMSAKNKAVLITGCDSGFGFLLARRLDQLGFHVFAGCLFPSGDGAQGLKNRTSPNLQILGLDVTKDQDVLNALQFVKENLKQNEELWSIVNNAGIACSGEIEWMSIENLQRTFDINTIGMVRVTKAFLPLVRKSKGRVVNTTSLSGRLTTPGYVGYCMSKTAAVSFTNGLRIEMAKFGVKAISIEPFFFKTPISDTKRILKTIENSFEESPDEVKEAYGRKYLNDFKQGCIKLTHRGSTNVEKVIDCFEDAIMAEEPQIDYFPSYLPDKLALKLMRLLPQPMVDTILEWHLPYFKNPAAL